MDRLIATTEANAADRCQRGIDEGPYTIGRCPEPATIALHFRPYLNRSRSHTFKSGDWRETYCEAHKS